MATCELLQRIGSTNEPYIRVAEHMLKVLKAFVPN